MGALGAHEVVVETPASRQAHVAIQRRRNRARSVGLGRAHRRSEERFALQIREPSSRIKARCAGDEWSHAHSQITATIFVPRRIKYELSSANEWYRERERCIFCDVVRQDEKQGKRIVDVQGDYYALCPYASRVPYEMWLMHRRHNHLVRAAPARLESQATGRLARPRLAATGKSRAGISPGRAHRAQYAQQKRRTGRLLEDARRRFSLAHRNPSHSRKAQQVLQHQRGLLQLAAARKPPNHCVRWIRIHEVVGTPPILPT